MKAVILVAGAGTRLGALTEQMPKCLLPLGGRALLDHHLDALAAAGIDDITVVAGYQANRVIDHVGDRCRVVVNQDYASTNSIVSLYRASAVVRGDAFVFQNGDVVYPPSLLRRFVEARHDNGCLVDPARPFVQGEYHVELDQGRIVRYSRDVPPEQSVGESAQLVKIGAASSAAFLDRLGEIIAGGGDQGFPNQAYDVLMRGDGFWPVYTAGLPWWEIDTADDYARCQESLIPPPPPPHKSFGAGVVSVLHDPRVPYRYRWVPVMTRLAARRPRRLLRQVPAYFKGELSLEALDLAVCGPAFLRLILHECERAGVQPFALWGTLLGCVRDGGLIRGDHDIDLGILEADFARLPAVRSAMLGHGFRVRHETNDKLSFVHHRHPRLFVDLDVVRRYGDGWAITNTYSDPPRRFHYRFGADVFGASKAMSLADLGEVHVPADPEGFLTAVYGDWSHPQPKTDFLYGPLNVEVEVPAGR